MSTIINPNTKTVRQLLNNMKYGIDFYQREYEWGRRNIEELFDDLEAKFMSEFDPAHSRQKVQQYPHYFLGTIITVKESGQSFIVDGQQRLTTLTLLMIYLHHLSKEGNGIAEVEPLIFSLSYGEKTFNINVPERTACMQALFENGTYDATNHHDLSVRNLVDRYNDIMELFPETLQNGTLPYFVDWMVDNVDLVELETYTDDDAFTIFETMNDRGMNLGPADMLKGYLLANINHPDEAIMHEKKTQANLMWKQRILELTALVPEEDVAFFKTWLRAKYAETIREHRKGATNREFENINKFHRWIRDERARLGLKETDDYYRLITEEINRFAGYYIQMRRASLSLTRGMEEFYYNAYNNLTLQYILALAPVRLEDDAATATKKMRLVAIYLDIFSARRIVNFRTLSYSSIQYTMFNIAKEIRNMDVEPLAQRLWAMLDNTEDTFDGVMSFYLHQQNYSRMKYMLARITAHIEQASGMPTSFDTYAAVNLAKPFEVEHIWANHFERHTDEFSDSAAFDRYRNRMGGLLLIPRGFNQSYGDALYAEKHEHYYGHNLLAKTLHPKCYQKNPNFLHYAETSRLPFQAHDTFKIADLDARQELYRAICEQIWTPQRLERELER